MSVAVQRTPALVTLPWLLTGPPPSAFDVQNTFDEIQRLFPNATIVSSTFEAFAAELATVADNLPVITDEIGDTWIHGVASDPRKVPPCPPSTDQLRLKKTRTPQHQRTLHVRAHWHTTPEGHSPAHDRHSRTQPPTTQKHVSKE